MGEASDVWGNAGGDGDGRVLLLLLLLLAVVEVVVVVVAIPAVAAPERRSSTSRRTSSKAGKGEPTDMGLTRPESASESESSVGKMIGVGGGGCWGVVPEGRGRGGSEARSWTRREE